ncbi:hypothetical protein AVEN_96036-1 [Araneus ventricosus]|uniref:Uncharacterized protein n=1 Tax=Araneus ventricosus TaxID=182803 RepID=A0A4Y2B3N5_ARAVE|nr:hypothetical protein AVEN_96036-1 [Araneus ventricosus]
MCDFETGGHARVSEGLGDPPEPSGRIQKSFAAKEDRTWAERTGFGAVVSDHTGDALRAERTVKAKKALRANQSSWCSGTIELLSCPSS